MSFEDIRPALKKETKSVGKTYNYIFLFMIVLWLGLLLLDDWEKDKFNSLPDSEFIDCTNSYTGRIDDNGNVDFTVFMRNPYKKEGTFVGKLQADKDDHLILFGSALVWHGTFDLKGNEFPSPIIYFQNSQTLNNSTRRHYYALNCPSLKPQLQEAALNWSVRPSNPVDNMRFEEQDPMYAPQESDEITCEDIIVVPPMGTHGKTDVAVYFRHPYAKDVVIDKYPMSENETILMKEKYAIWHGSFNLENHEKFPRTLISFQKTLRFGYIRHIYYTLTCPILEKELEELSVAWWNNHKAWIGKQAILVVVFFVALGCQLGLIWGDSLAREAVAKKLQLA